MDASMDVKRYMNLGSLVKVVKACRPAVRVGKKKARVPADTVTPA
jgi:hypothetical protein